MSDAPAASAAPTADPDRGTIGLIPCLAFAVGAMVGGGVFTLSGTAINEAGPGALISYGIAGAIMLVSALSFVAVAARAAPGDSGYEPISGLIGRPWRFLVMWGFYLNAVLMVAFLAVSFGAYLHDYFLSEVGATAAGIVCVLLVIGLNLGPAALVGKAETYVVGLKIGLLFVFIGYGLAAITGSDFSPLEPRGNGSIFATSALLFTAYTGFNVVTNMSSSVKDPAKTVPRAVIGAVLISIVIYMGVVVAMLASGIKEFGPAGVAQAADVLMGDWGGQLIAFAACLSTLSGANAQVLGASEITLRLVVQRDIPERAGLRTPAGFPWVSVGLVGLIGLVLVLFSNIDFVVAVGNIVALIAMIIVNVAAGVLAWRKWPGTGPRLPGGVTIPIIAGLACLAQFGSFDTLDTVSGVIAMLLGLLVYAVRHRGDTRQDVTEEVEESVLDRSTPLARALHGPTRTRSKHVV